MAAAGKNGPIGFSNRTPRRGLLVAEPDPTPVIRRRVEMVGSGSATLPPRRRFLVAEPDPTLADMRRVEMVGSGSATYPPSRVVGCRTQRQLAN